ncbi:hypothetical protein CEE37_07625 [candidate division LCP-89 bacterium B3_LCP]|uniref:NarG-like domain-containing protein n=1 Tax=candidate division LCP-89 bacterium B3_LCP TaxID=2012998 RepID=A0A532V0T5_UNCL8|nr:MAG: hypothetical protein CEE37_07625 [candidate division LCP-89 bacterium B3_LCP]
MGILHLLAYLTFAVFVVAIAARAIRIAKMPVHLRWELYPVPHEKGKAKYGGSILEELDWWTKERHKDYLGELKVMIPEILFLKAIWEYNRKMWFGTFPLHFGLYLLIGNTVLLAAMGLLSMANVELAFLVPVTYVIGWIGCVLGVIGAVYMIILRIADSGLAKFSTPSHFLNLFMLGAIYVTGILWLSSDPNVIANSSGFFRGLVAPSVMPSLPVTAYLFIGFSLVFMFYLPFTHMTHFFTKYFTYHSVRWEDETNLPGDPLQDKINPQLEQVVTWSAPHVGADGKKNWVDIATSPVPKKEKEEK